MSILLLNEPDPLRRLEWFQHCAMALIDSAYLACQSVHDEIDEVSAALAHADRAMCLTAMARDCVARSQEAIEAHHSSSITMNPRR